MSGHNLYIEVQPFTDFQNDQGKVVMYILRLAGKLGENVDYSCSHTTVCYRNMTARFSFWKCRYLYEVARRHPYFYAPELLYYAQQYKGVFAECCQAADKAACLTPKVLCRGTGGPIHIKPLSISWLDLGNLCLWYKLLYMVKKAFLPTLGNCESWWRRGWDKLYAKLRTQQSYIFWGISGLSSTFPVSALFLGDVSILVLNYLEFSTRTRLRLLSLYSKIIIC